MAPEFKTTELQSILNAAKSQLGNFGGVAGTSSSNNNTFVNSVWGLTEQAEQAVNGDDQQKAQALTNIVQKLFSVLTSLGTNENSTATREVKNNEQKEAELSKKASQSAEDTESKVKNIIANISDNTTSISEAIDVIKELGGDNGLIADAQKQLEEQIEIIESNKEILNNGVSSPEAKEAALQAIESAGAVITQLCGSIQNVQKEIEAQNSVVETSTNNIAGLVEESASTIENGAKSLQAFMQQGSVQTGVEATTATTGTANEIVGAKATAMGETSSWVPVVGQTAGQNLIRVGIDQTMAGKTRIQGSAQNLSTLTAAIGKMGSDLSNLSEFVGSVGKIGDDVVELVGQYDAALTPVITATGSWATVEEANAQMAEAVQEYKTQNGIETTTNNWSNETSKSSEKTSENNEEAGMFNFDTNLFRKALETEKA